MADIDRLLQELTLEEKVILTAGEDMMSTVPVGRLGIPKVRLTDGPNGARGESYPGMGGAPSTCTPCGSALGATWDPALAEQIGAFVAREALDRGCRGLLAPTVNLHRSPLAGRNFECFSEDPFLSGRLAARYVRGVQSAGVFATVKHFVGNDAEFERNSMNSVIDERSLRELYCVPFEMVVREGGTVGLMTAYNRLNGSWVTEQRAFLTDLLRNEWGFEGLVMTDWFGVANTELSLAAGLDLEMPGPGRSLGSALLAAIDAGHIGQADVDEAVRHLLEAFDRVGALDAPTPPVAPKSPSPEDRLLIRHAAAEATVLLKNDGILPLRPASLARLAVIGPRAASPAIMGGGSAQVIPHRVTSPLDAVSAALGAGVEIRHARGCDAERSPTLVGREILFAPEGFKAEVFEGLDFEGEPVGYEHLNELRLCVLRSLRQGYPADDWSLRIRGVVVPKEGATFHLALSQAGRARVYLNGDLVLDGFTNPPPIGGTDFFGQGSVDLCAEVTLEAGEPAEFVVEYARIETVIDGVRVGYRILDEDAAIGRAVKAAQWAEVVLVFVGTSSEWETEGYDRRQLHLPGRQDELVKRVAAVNSRTVVIVNAGAPVDLSWADQMAAVLLPWFGGEEMGPALADVLTGSREPGGRLPTTIPWCLEQAPSFDNFPGENGELRYGEGLFMGYRGYDHRSITPRFPFGHGLSYTQFLIGEPELSAQAIWPDECLTVSVPVKNCGKRRGSEVVQCYVAPVAPRLVRPPKELKAFAKVTLDPDEETVVQLQLSPRSFAYWDPGQPDWEALSSRVVLFFGPNDAPGRREPGWQVDPGEYRIAVGRSSADITASRIIEIRRAEER